MKKIINELEKISKKLDSIKITYQVKKEDEDIVIAILQICEEKGITLESIECYGDCISINDEYVLIWKDDK